MPIQVPDPRSNTADQIARAVQVLGRATQRISVFRAIYSGKKSVKTVNEIATSTGLDRIRVLQEGRRLADNQIVNQIRAAGTTAYEKHRFYAAHKSRILRLVQNPVAFATLPVVGPSKRPSRSAIRIEIPTATVKIRMITIDEIDSFSRVRRLRVEPQSLIPMPETQFKRGVANILHERGRFRDWSGEKNDLFSTRLRLSGRRSAAAFAFKGPATKGVLTPRKMGKNGDQIQRLFSSSASVFLIQYHGEIAESVIEQMEQFAKVKSVAIGDVIHYGVIDGNDSFRLVQAYSDAFNN